MSRLTTAVCIALCALCAVPALAGAKPATRDFNHTYPYASKLCAKAQAGHTPKRLAGSTAEIVGYCGTLSSSFSDAKTTYQTAIAPLKQQAKDAVTTARAACQAARAAGDQAACKTARQTAITTLKGLRAQVKTAAGAYHTSVQAARKTFWTAIRALPGGTSVKADTTVPPAPDAGLPSDTAVANA